MEKFCNGCESSHQPLSNVWTKQGSLQPSNFNPFDSVYAKENYCSSSYNTLETSYLPAYNITPNNSSIYNQGVIKFTPMHKEKFAYNSHSTYARMGQTWETQAPYTTN